MKSPHGICFKKGQIIRLLEDISDEDNNIILKKDTLLEVEDDNEFLYGFNVWGSVKFIQFDTHLFTHKGLNIEFIKL